MPFYEYQCQACGEKTEELQKVNDPPLLQCPACDQNKLKRVISLTGFQLTGTGWYETDFKDKKPQPVVETETNVGSAPAEKAADNQATEKKVEKPKEKKTTEKSVDAKTLKGEKKD